MFHGFTITFVICFAIDYILGEQSVKKYNKYLDKLENEVQ